MSAPLVVVVSPHLDDAVMSVGAWIHRLTRNGVRVRVLTVLAGDPDSTLPSGRWDRRSGSATAGEAARRRRDEDRAACLVVGAEPAWLSYADRQYPRGGSDANVVGAIAPHLEHADATVWPGFPLRHPDHRWLVTLALNHGLVSDRESGFYVEQPYVVLRRRYQVWRRPLEPGVPAGFAPEPFDAAPWRVQPAEALDWEAKWRACECYASQLPLLRARLPSVFRRVRRYEGRRGGETIGWWKRVPQRLADLSPGVT